MSDDLQAELARLRAENLRLNEQVQRRQDDQAVRMNGELSRMVRSAQREEMTYRQIQNGGLNINTGDVNPLSREAADIVLRDLGLA